MRCVRRHVEIVAHVASVFFDFPGQLKNWLRVQGVSPKLDNFGQQILPYSPRFQLQDCLSLLNLLLLLDATGFPAAFRSIRQGMHPLVALETSTLRRMSSILILLSGFPEAIGIPGLFGYNRTRWGGDHCWSRLGHNSFFFFLILYPLRQCGAAYQAESLDAASGAEMSDIEQMKKILPFVTREISLWSRCLRVGVWCR